MRVIFQLLNVADGTRSQAFAMDREELAATFDKLTEEETENQRILILMEEGEPGDMQVSFCPVLSIQHFSEIFDPQKQVERAIQKEEQENV